MKTINGNNKRERKINITKKYLEIDLEHWSNTKLKIMNWNKDKDYFIVTDNYYYSRDGKLVIVKPINSTREKPYFFKSFGTLELSSFANGKAIIIKPYFPDDIKDLRELAKGHDDVFDIETYPNEKLTVDCSGKR